MKVICKENRAQNLDLTELVTTLHKDYEYPLTIGKEYLVMGILMYTDANCPYYLIDLNGSSYWMPYGLFDISDKAFPPNWHIKIFDKKTNPDFCIFIAGFYELCNDKNFYVNLIEREFEASAIYCRRKQEILAWYIDREEARKFYPEEAKVYYSIND